MPIFVSSIDDVGRSGNTTALSLFKSQNVLCQPKTLTAFSDSSKTGTKTNFTECKSSFNFQRCFLVVKCSKMDGFWIFKKPDKPIYISGYAGSMKNVNLKLFEPTVELRTGQSLRLGSKSEI